MGEETEKPPAGRVSIFVIAKTFLAKKSVARRLGAPQERGRRRAAAPRAARHRRGVVPDAGQRRPLLALGAERRAALRFEPDIVRWMQSYYRTFVSPHNNKRFKASHGGYAPIDREEMLAVQIKICKALFPPDEWDFAACAESAEADWQREVGADAELMSRAQFFDSLFEIVDVWTVDISLAEYVNFLKAVFHRITVAGSNVDLHPDAGPKTGSEALKHKRLSSKRLLDPDQRFWAPTCEIVSLHEDAPPDDAGADAAGSPGGAGGAGGAPPRAPMLHKTSSRSVRRLGPQPVRRLGPQPSGRVGPKTCWAPRARAAAAAAAAARPSAGSRSGRSRRGCGASWRPCAARASRSSSRAR